MTRKPKSRIGLARACAALALALLSLFAPRASEAAELRSIQRGTATMGTAGNLYVALPTAIKDTTKAFLVFSYSTANSAVCSKLNVMGQILGDDTLFFSRADKTNSNLNAISWEVYEFTSGVFVQRGFANTTANPTNVTLGTAVDLSKSFAIATLMRNGTAFGTDDAATAELTTSTNLAIRYGTTPVDSAAWQVIQYDDAFVQQVSTTLSAASSSTTGTIPVSVATGRTLLLTQYNINGDITAGELPRAELTNGTTITYTRGGATTRAISLFAYVVQFTDSTTVQRGTSSMGAGTGSANVTLSPPVEMARSAVMLPGHMGRGGSTNHTNEDSLGFNWFKAELTSSTNLGLTRGNSAAWTGECPWQVVQFSKNGYADRLYSTRIQFNTTSTGANVATDQANFPVLVRLDANNFLFTQADPNGADVRFSDPDGAPLKYEIERWDATARTAEIWVRVPQVDGNSDRDFIRMHWGNASAQSASSGAAAFDTAAGFRGVWHLNSAYSDASLYANNGTNSGSTDAAGQIGRGRDFAAGSSQYVEVPYAANLELGSFTFSAWTKVAVSGSSRGIISSRFGGEYTFDAQWDNANLHADIGTGSGWLTTAADYANSLTLAWNHVAYTVTANAYSVYLNGALVASGTYAGTPKLMKSGQTLRIGQTMNNGYFSGTIDEARIENGVRSANWVKLAYENQRANGKFLSFPDYALSTWNYSTKLYVNTSPTGANINTSLTNYPLLVRLTGSNFPFSQAQSTGADLRFADSTGAQLAYEIERFDASAKAAEIWVLLPNVAGNNANQWFRMYWGKSTATSLSSGNSVFLTSNGFAGVWHLSENGSTTAGAYRDASSYGNHGTGQNGMDGNSDVAAVVGIGSNFTAASNHGIYSSTAASLHPTTAMTLQVWVNTTSQGSYKRIAGRPFTSATSPWNEFDFELDGGGNKVAYSLTVGGTEAAYSTITSISNGTWYMVTGTYDGSWQRVWLNGTLETGAARSGTISDYGQTFSIGKYVHDNGSNLDGKVDEVRLSTVARSADWIKMDYQTMKAGSAVVSVGTRPADYAASLRLNFNTVGVTSTNVTNIPILVSLSAANFDFFRTHGAGTDIQFVDPNGAYLFHEIAEWDTAAKSAKVWVKVPQVDANSTTDYITLYYGCATCTTSPWARADSVWGDYAFALHLNAQKDRPYDSSPNALHGTYNAAMPSGAGLTAPLAPYFDGTAGNVSIANASALDGEAITYSFWIKTTQTGSVAGNWWETIRLADRDQNGLGNAGWAVGFDHGAATSKINFIARDDELLSTGTVGDGIWHHVSLVKSATHKYIYIDGALDASEADAGAISNDETFYIGSGQGGGRWFQGMMGEAHLAGSARSADFIKLSYWNQKASSTLFSSTTISTSSFQKSKVYKFNTTASGANVAGDVHDFPVLIRITGSAMCDAVQSGAPDIRFLAGDGVTWLDYQIERWDQSVDSAEVWVKVPVIRGNSASESITLWYQQAPGATVPDGQCASCVFGAYRSVLHLSQDPGGGAPQFTDASGNADHGTAGNGASGDRVSAAIGKGFQLNGSNRYISTALQSTHQQIFTVGGWFKTTTAQGGMLVGWDGGATTPSGSHDRHIWMANDGKLHCGTYNGGFQIVSSSASYNDGNWHQAYLRFSPAGTFLYVDGALVNSNTLYNVAENSTGYWRAGNGTADWAPTPTSSHLNATIDEIRFAHAEMSADWIKLEYQNQRRDASPLFNPSPADFVSSRKYAFNTTKTGANIPSDVTDFPLLLRITGSAIVDAVQNDYDDIRFLDGDGKTWLNYQVERWDKAKDSAEVWVLVPRVDAYSDHDNITLYFDDATNGAVADGQCAACVFSPGNGFAAVWHLNSEFADHTGNGNTGTDNGTTASSVAVIAGGRDFNGSTQYITAASSTSLNPTGALGLSAWIHSDSWSGGNRRILQKSTAGNDDQYILKDESDQLEFFSIGPSDNYHRTTLPTTGAWHHVFATHNGSVRKIYVDGAEVASEASTGTLGTTAGALDIGRKPGTASAGDYFDGTIDEVRVENTARSADWIKLAYESQRRTNNLFWNSRTGPNNLATLTATAGVGSINLSWSSTVSDSANADSIGIWVKYSAFPDSANADSTTRVVRLPKTDSSYSYPADYPATYYFGLAVRNSNGAWSPITSSSSDTAVLAGPSTYTDTVYVDSAIGKDTYTCTQARNPATPARSIKAASACETNSVTDTLVIRVMPGVYSDSAVDPNSKPIVVASFDRNSRAVLGGYGSFNDAGARQTTFLMFGNLTLRDMDVKAANASAYYGVYMYSGDANMRIDGCRIYNGSATHTTGIHWFGNANNNIHVANTLVHKPSGDGILIGSDNSYNVVNNVVVGNGTAAKYGIRMYNAAGATDMTIANNILYNWDYGINTASANIGVCSNNLFFQVTSGREVTGTSDAAKILKDPLFASLTVGDKHAFKLLPGSPAIDAGTATYGSGAAAVPYRAYHDHFGNDRPLGSGPEIGLYEGTGYTPNPSGEFDSLSTSSTATTLTVENAKWKITWDAARGAGITGFYDKTTAPSTNLLAASSLLFDAKIDSYQASAQTSAGPQLAFLERSRARAVVRQRLGVSASLDLNIYYTLYPSGHVWIESELANTSASTAAVGTVDYILKLNAAGDAYASAGSKNGFGYLLTTTRDVLLAASRDLDAGASAAETWSASSAASGTPGTVTFSTTNLADLAGNTKRRHAFLMYVGDNALDFPKAAALNADAYGPSALSISAGSLALERTWQDGLQGHWTLDDGAGASARDKAVYVQNNASLSGSGYKWVSGKAGGGLYLTAADVATVADNSALEAALGMTLMFWIKPDFAGMGTTAYVISKGLTSSDGYFVRKVSGQNQLAFTMGSATVTSPTLTDGAWTHIAVVVWSNGARQAEMYVNGALSAASTSAATAAANASALLFGYSAGGTAADKFQGTLDDIRLLRNEIHGHDVQAVYNRGFASRYGHYALRADNNNRVVALINGGGAQTRVQPAFQITNWFAAKTPKYVYLNGSRLSPLTDYVVDSIGNSVYGAYLVLQVNKILTGADQTLFIDDDDSSGYLGSAVAMKALAISATANDKIAIRNFSDTVFGSPSSGQWYVELDLNGWTTNTVSRLVDTGFGGFNVWKAAAVSPNVAVGTASNLAAIDDISGRGIVQMKFDNGAVKAYGGGMGYASPANISYTLVDSSATRLSLTLTPMSMSSTAGTFTLTKRWTVYPNGRIFGSWVASSLSGNLGDPNLDIQGRYNSSPTSAFGTTYMDQNARAGWYGGDLGFHSIVGGILSVKNNTSTYTGDNATNLGDHASYNGYAVGGADYRRARLGMVASQFNAGLGNITTNFFVDIGRDFTDSATADSLAKDVQTPGVITAITGSRITNDALDFNADNFAEGDGAYTYQAASGLAHFRFANTVSSFSPAFRISSWTYGTLPEFVLVDNQIMARGFQYNAYINTASNELILQFNRTFAPGTHAFYISHKTGLAVALRAFTANGGDGVDTLAWTTESEFENLGFHVWRRLAPAAEQIDTALALAGNAAGAGIANALAGAARVEAAKRAADKLAKAQAGDTVPADTLPSLILSARELEALGYVRITPRLLPGAKGGSSASTQDYRFLDRTAEFDAAYEYLLEAVDFNGNRVQYGPRLARPGNPLATELGTNYPNPFNPVTTLRFSLKEKLKVSLVIYDSKGRLVRTLVRNDKAMLPGRYRLSWDAKDEAGVEVPSGQYFYRFTAGRYAKTRKMILVK